MTSRWARRSGVALCVAGALTLAVLSGCNILGPALLIAHGPERVPAEFKLDAYKATTVLVDDPNTILPRRSHRVVVSQTVEQVLLKKDALKTDMISSQYVQAALNREDVEERRSIPDIGREVGAEMVIWVTFDRFALSPDGQTYQPTAQARVKVVDVASGEPVWPEERGGYRLSIKANERASDVPRTYSQLAQAERAFAEYCGKAIAELFYAEEKVFSARAGN